MAPLSPSMSPAAAAAAASAVAQAAAAAAQLDTTAPVITLLPAFAAGQSGVEVVVQVGSVYLHPGEALPVQQ